MHWLSLTKHLFLVVVSCSLALFSCTRGVSRQAKAVVLSAEGSAMVERDGGGTSQSVAIGSQLSVSDVIETGEDGRLRLRLLPGLLAALGNNSQLQIEELRVAKDGNAMVDAMLLRKAQLRLSRGLLDAVVQKADAASATLIVDTPFGLVNASGGCVCRITVADQRARILCVRGTLQIQASNGSPTVVDAGFFVDWPAPADAVLAADSNGEVQSDVVGALDKVQELLTLQSREVFSPAPWRRPNTKKP